MREKATRPARSALALALAALQGLGGCSAVQTREHRTDAAPSVTVRATWEDGRGQRWYVGGLTCALDRLDGDRAHVGSLRTVAGEPIVFPALEPGRYRLTVQGADLPPLEHELDLPPRRRVTVRIDVAAAREEAGEGPEDRLLTIAGGVLLLPAYLIFMAIEGALGDDEDACGMCGYETCCPECDFSRTCGSCSVPTCPMGVSAPVPPPRRR